MKRALKIAGVALGVIAALLVVTVVSFVVVSNRRLAAHYDVPTEPVVVPTDASSIAEGERLYVSRGCGECHGARGEGKVVIDDAPGLLAGANLTATAERYSDADFARAIRHGVAPDGSPLVFMPSGDFWAMSDRDVGMIIAFIRSLPRVEHAVPACELRPVGQVLHVLGLFPAAEAERIDHDAPRPHEVPIAKTAAYGEYLSHGCTGCHGEHLSGGPIPGAPPELGIPKNLTPHESGLASWTEPDFFELMRHGERPDGSHVDPRQMPYPVLSRMTDVELGALFVYLQTLPPRPFGER
jgi:mono/diheme cytochrome c family protein